MSSIERRARPAYSSQSRKNEETVVGGEAQRVAHGTAVDDAVRALYYFSCFARRGGVPPAQAAIICNCYIYGK